MTQRAISWPLLVIKLIEKGGYVWSLGMAHKYMWQEGGLLDWQWPCGRNEYLCVFGVHACPSVYVHASASVCGIILENLSL